MALKRSGVRIPLGPLAIVNDTIRCVDAPSSHDEGAFCFLPGYRKGTVVANQKRNPLDELAKRLRGLLDDIDRLLSPQPSPKPVRVPVPVPVRRPPQNGPYR
jgi:hypothetical protein